MRLLIDVCRLAQRSNCRSDWPAEASTDPAISSRSRLAPSKPSSTMENVVTTSSTASVMVVDDRRCEKMASLTERVASLIL